MSADVAARLRERIGRLGPVPFDQFMEAALYDPDGGFFAAGSGAGRAEGDFLTSPEVGSLFGALVARALDGWWRRLGSPDPFLVVEAGAGRGQLARDVLRASPECGPAMRYVMVERSAALRRLQHEHLQVEPPDEALGPALRVGQSDEVELVPGTGPIVTQMESMPAGSFTGVVVANELLDNLPFRMVEVRDGRWHDVRVSVEGERFAEIVIPAEGDMVEAADHLLGAPEAFPEATRFPLQTGILDWMDECSRAVRRGVVALFDYAAEAQELARRGPSGWLRTYRAHGRGGDPLADPGMQDVTADVVIETLRVAARREGFGVEEEQSQAEWLERLGIRAMAEDGRRTWEARAHVGDLEALKARSVGNEAAALTDPAGLGAHRVVVLTKGM